jgi:putative copper export protein
MLAASEAVLSVNAHTVRLYLHVLAATVWVGGQLTLAGLVPGLRSLDADAPRIVARRFNQIAWPAYAVLVGTGVWNIVAVSGAWTGRYGTTLILKIVVVAASGVSAAAHAASTSKAGLALWGAVTGVSALSALFLGVLLHG